MFEVSRDVYSALPVISQFRGAGRVVAKFTMDSLLNEPQPDLREYRTGIAANILDKRLNAIADLLESDVHTKSSRGVATGSYDAVRRDLFKESQITSSAQNLEVRRYILAHELGHAALHAILEAGKISDPLRQQFAKEANRETFCREFSAEIILPSKVLENLQCREITDGLSETEARNAARVARSGGPRLNFYQLSSFARRAGVPLTIAIGSLNRHRVLAELQVAVSIFRVSANVYTSQEWGLRTWMNSCPPWGFLPKNQRVARLGFVGAQDVLTKGKSGSSQQCKETLVVKYRRPPELEERPRWRSVELQTWCSYTPIDVTSRGRYLLVTWDWLYPSTVS